MVKGSDANAAMELVLSRVNVEQTDLSFGGIKSLVDARRETRPQDLVQDLVPAP